LKGGTIIKTNLLTPRGNGSEGLKSSRNIKKFRKTQKGEKKPNSGNPEKKSTEMRGVS